SAPPHEPGRRTHLPSHLRGCMRVRRATRAKSFTELHPLCCLTRITYSVVRRRPFLSCFKGVDSMINPKGPMLLAAAVIALAACSDGSDNRSIAPPPPEPPPPAPEPEPDPVAAGQA